MSVRGEVYLAPRGFRTHQSAAGGRTGEHTYANPRNTTAGSLKQLDPAVTAPAPAASSSPTESGAQPWALASLDSQWESSSSSDAGGYPSTRSRGGCESVEEVVAYQPDLEAQRKSLPYEIDGVVVKVNAISVQEEAGDALAVAALGGGVEVPAAGGANPGSRHRRAGRPHGRADSGRAPRAGRVGGVTVSNATLHNQDEIDRKDVRVGDWVFVRRAGDVIPEVVAPIVEAAQGFAAQVPHAGQVPVCGTAVVRPEGEAVTRCPNATCPTRRCAGGSFTSRRVARWTSKGWATSSSTSSWRGVGRNARRTSTSSRSRTSFPWNAWPRNPRATSSRPSSIRKHTTLPRFIYALGIRNIGETVAEFLAEHAGSMDALMKASEEELAEIHGVGDVIAREFRTWADVPYNRKLVEKLLKAGITLADARHVQSDEFAGKTFVFTGTLTKFTREDAEAEVKRRGGKAAVRCPRTRRYVVAGEKAGSKLEKAQKLGVEVISEDDFLEMIGR